jgi:hypothetical protein
MCRLMLCGGFLIMRLVRDRLEFGMSSFHFCFLVDLAMQVVKLLFESGNLLVDKVHVVRLIVTIY